MKKIKITDIKKINTEKPIYILVGGSIGAGKSYIINNFLQEYNIVDPDEITMSLGDGKYNPIFVSQSMNIVKKMVSDKFKNGESFIQQGTSANFNTTINKLTAAKNNNFITVFLYIETPLEQAKKNILSRIDRNQIPDYKVERTYNGAKNTYNNLLDDAICDYLIHYKN